MHMSHTFKFFHLLPIIWIRISYLFESIDIPIPYVSSVAQIVLAHRTVEDVLHNVPLHPP